MNLLKALITAFLFFVVQIVWGQKLYRGVSMGVNFSSLQFDALNPALEENALRSGISPGYFFSTHSRLNLWFIDISSEIQFSRIENSYTVLQNGQEIAQNFRINRLDIPVLLELNIGLVHFGGGIGGALNFLRTSDTHIQDFSRWNTYWLLNAGVRFGPVSLYGRMEFIDNAIAQYIENPQNPNNPPLATDLSLFRLGVQITF
ncbi:MAG: hypothetical protein LAT76_06130 [Schleiferiaceae bacterium]|nr:hypothetical protein [Schleiferiaceae bacterium]